MSVRPRYGWTEAPAAPLEPLPVEQQPRFSVLIPSYNQGEYIEDTLCSILQQQYQNLELIVVDAASTDATPAVLERYRDRIDVLIQEPDNGQSEAINKGFHRASGEILAWINSDDFLLPGALHTVARLFQRHPESAMVIGAGDVISADQRFLRHAPGRDLSDETLFGFRDDRWILQQACFWKASLWQAAGGVDESLHLLMDYDLWFRFAALTQPLVIQQKLGAMRYYSDVKTVRQSNRLHSELAYVYAKNGAHSALRQLVSELDADASQARAELVRLRSQPAWRLLRRARLIR